MKNHADLGFLWISRRFCARAKAGIFGRGMEPGQHHQAGASTAFASKSALVAAQVLTASGFRLLQKLRTARLFTCRCLFRGYIEVEFVVVRFDVAAEFGLRIELCRDYRRIPYHLW
jgi:hypothetical protein